MQKCNRSENSHQTEKSRGRAILTHNIGLSGEYGVLELVGNHTEFVIGGPVNGDGVIGSRAELFSNCGRVGSCGEQDGHQQRSRHLWDTSQRRCLTVKAGLLKHIHQNCYPRDGDANPKSICLAGYITVIFPR